MNSVIAIPCSVKLHGALKKCEVGVGFSDREFWQGNQTSNSGFGFDVGSSGSKSSEVMFPCFSSDSLINCDFDIGNRASTVASLHDKDCDSIRDHSHGPLFSS